MKRRDFLKYGLAAGAVGELATRLAWADEGIGWMGQAVTPAAPAISPPAAPVAALLKPNWLSFGLNGPAQGATRFPLTASLSQARVGRKGDFQMEVSQAIARQLKSDGNLVEFRDSADINGGLLLGAVLDYENVLSAKVGSSSFIVMHLVGHGVLLNFDRTRGWKMMSSFPFPVTLLRETQGGNTAAEALKYLPDAYGGSQNSFATAFVQAAKRVAPRWRDTERGFNVRVMSSTIHPEVQGKLAAWGIARNISQSWLGHLTSAALCEGLAIPVVPFVETQALGKFTYKFSEKLVAQNVRLPDENDIDLRLHVTLRNIGREVKFRNQYQRWEVMRMVVLDLKVLDDRNEEVLSLRMGYQDEVPDSLAAEQELVPARDAHFFDMAIYRGLTTLFTGIDKQDKALLAKVFVTPDADQQKRLDTFRAKYQKAV